MATIEMTTANVNDLIGSDGIVLIDFWAPWCGPCRTFKPIFEKAAQDHPDITFATCNTENEQELAMGFQIRSIPTLMAFREGVLVFNQPGMLPAEVLEGLIGQVQGLDMAQVHAEVAAQKAKADQA